MKIRTLHTGNLVLRNYAPTEHYHIATSILRQMIQCELGDIVQPEGNDLHEALDGYGGINGKLYLKQPQITAALSSIMTVNFAIFEKGDTTLYTYFAANGNSLIKIHEMMRLGQEVDLSKNILVIQQGEKMPEGWRPLVASHYFFSEQACNITVM